MSENLREEYVQHDDLQNVRLHHGLLGVHRVREAHRVSENLQEDHVQHCDLQDVRLNRGLLGARRVREAHDRVAIRLEL